MIQKKLYAAVVGALIFLVGCSHDGQNSYLDLSKPIPGDVKLEGLSGQESFGRWSSGQVVTIAFDHYFPSDLNVNMKFATSYKTVVNKPVFVAVAGERRTFVAQENEYEVSLDYMNVPKGTNILTITIPTANIEKDRLKSDDLRNLGLAMMSIKITKIISKN